MLGGRGWEAPRRRLREILQILYEIFEDLLIKHTGRAHAEN